MRRSSRLDQRQVRLFDVASRTWTTLPVPSGADPVWSSDSRFLYIHASLDPKLDLNEQPDFLLFWQQFQPGMTHKSGKRILCGHTAQRDGQPALFAGGICIDTFAYGGGWLTCFETTSQTFLQANERGEQRQFDLRSLPDSP